MKALDNLTINQKYGLVLKEDIEKTNCVISKQKQQIERLQEQKQKVIALIKDGRFVEALQELENEDRL